MVKCVDESMRCHVARSWKGKVERCEVWALSYESPQTGPVVSFIAVQVARREGMLNVGEHGQGSLGDYS